MKKIMSFINDFKDFLLGSTFIDVAIGLLIAGAVKDLATSYTNSFITPIIMKCLSVLGVSDNMDEPTRIFGIDFYVGAFITAIIAFLIIMFVAFSILQVYARMKDKFVKEASNEEDEKRSNEEKILLEIRDLLKEKSETNKEDNS